MENDLFALISGESAKFSKGQRLIAQYIQNSYDKAAFMTAGKLGKTVGVSESTVVRFATELGYDGYPDMRKALQEMVRNRLTSVQRIQVAQDVLDSSNVLKTVMSADIDKLKSTLDELNRKSFDAAVDAIVSAKNVYVVGLRSSASLAEFLAFYLNLLMDNVHHVHDTDVSNVYEQIMRIGVGDLYIGLSFPRYTSTALNAMKFAKGKGAATLALTDNSASPFSTVADTLLYAKSDMVSFLDSLVAPMSLINALIIAIGVRNPEALADKFTNLERIWGDYEVFTGNEE
jgi:Transcriptional regulators